MTRALLHMKTLVINVMLKMMMRMLAMHVASLFVSSAILTTVMSVLRSRGLEQFGSDDKKMAALDIKPLLQFDSWRTKRDLIRCRLLLVQVHIKA